MRFTKGHRAVAVAVRLAVLSALAVVLGAAPALAGHGPDTVLYLWAGDKGSGETTPEGKEFDQPDDNDFLAVMDAQPSSLQEGRIRRTIAVFTPVVASGFAGAVGNEPHHAQPFVPPACRTVFAGGLFSDFWHQFDIGALGSSRRVHPVQTQTINPLQTKGSVPDAAYVLPNCQALGTEMGGEPLESTLPDGGFAGSHGYVIRMNAPGNAVLENKPADRPRDQTCATQWNFDPAELDAPGGPWDRKTSSSDCLPSNPHGIWARPDLNELVTSDYATPRQVVAPAGAVMQAEMSKLTVRHWDLNPACTGNTPPGVLTDCMSLRSVVLLPDGPRAEANEGHEENVGVMETATTEPSIPALNPAGIAAPASKGAFATTMCGGVLYYTGDITAHNPTWREVFDYTAAMQELNPGMDVPTAGCTGGGAVTVSPDNEFVVHSIIGREEGQTSLTGGIGGGTDPREFSGMLVKLDIAALIAAGVAPTCTIDTMDEVFNGGDEPDCPTIDAVFEVVDDTTGGPHFFSFDYPNYAANPRLAFYNYFVSESGIGGDLSVCMLDFDTFDLDPGFPGANVAQGQTPGSGCISFDRASWPADVSTADGAATRRANAGPAKPHYGVFANTHP